MYTSLTSFLNQVTLSSSLGKELVKEWENDDSFFPEHPQWQLSMEWKSLSLSEGLELLVIAPILWLFQKRTVRKRRDKLPLHCHLTILDVLLCMP